MSPAAGHGRLRLRWTTCTQQALLLLATLLAGGCLGMRVTPVAIKGLSWPAEAPRVRLVQVIPLGTRLAGGGRKLLSAITGSQDAAGPFRRPYAVAWDHDALLIADPDAGRIARLRAGGRIEVSPAGAIGRPIGVAACPQGVVVTDPYAGTVTLLDADLHRLRELAHDLHRPTGVACLSGRVVVAETGRHRLVLLAADGTRSILGARGSGPLGFNFPTSLAAARGILWVGDALNFRLQAIELTAPAAADGSPGTPGYAVEQEFGRLGDAPGDMPRLKGLAVDRAGDLWVADAHLDRVSLYHPDGRLLLSIGGHGTAPGSFSFPAGIAAHADGRVAVVDSLNRRVQVFERLLVAPETAP